MTKPSDFSPGRALEVRNPEDADRAISRSVWMLRIAGAILLVGAWAIVSLHHIGSAEFVAYTAIFGTLGGYAFAAAAQSRRAAVNMERKLRLELLVHNMELENMAMRDDLTQLFSRRYLFDRLEAELETARGFHRPLAVMMIDLDSMSAINDRFGYRSGDRVLAGLGSFLLGHTRGSDVPARIGGDKFAIVLPDTPEAAAIPLLDRLRESLEKTELIEDGDISALVSARFGISGYPWGGDSVDTILQLAEASMRRDSGMPLPESYLSRVPTDTPSNGIPAIFLKSADTDDLAGASPSEDQP